MKITYNICYCCCDLFQCVLPSLSGEWVSMAQKPMIPDNRQFKEVFYKSPHIVLLDLATKANQQDPNRKHDRGKTTSRAQHI